MSPSHAGSRWKPSFFSLAISVLMLVSTAIGLYPSTAAWLNSYQQSLLIIESTTNLEHLDPNVETQFEMAKAYNDALVAGISLEAGANVPTGFGENVSGFTYRDVLNAGDSGIMGRVKIHNIDVDLPIYHGTDHDTLLKGAGHLEGSHLPIGGLNTRTVITAHRGLANATMFTNLDKVKEGDRFQLVTLGEVLTYEVREIKVIDPDDTESLRVVPGKDLATLITCTPLGVNSHRIVVTGERVTPTPIRDIEEANADPIVPRFPWWIVFGAAGITISATYLIRSGFVDAKRAKRRNDAQQVANNEDTQPNSSENIGVNA